MFRFHRGSRYRMRPVQGFVAGAAWGAQRAALRVHRPRGASLAQRLSSIFATTGFDAEPPKFITPGREDLGASARLVVGHLGRQPAAERVRQPRHRDRGRGRRLACARRSRCRSGRSATRCATPVPANSQRCPAARRARPAAPGGTPGPSRRYWTPTSAASGRPRSRQRPTRRIEPSLIVTRAEEVVGRQEHQVAARVAVAADDVVRVPRDVLLVTREHDQVVQARQVRTACEPRRDRRQRACRRSRPVRYR